jgi:hypothetical protein
MNTAEETPTQTFDKVRTLATEKCHSACDQAKELVKKNPLPTVLGALAFGAAIGYVVYSRRESHSLADRLLRESRSVRRQLAGVPGRFSSILHDGLDVASQGAGRANRFIHDLPTDHVLDSVSGAVNRAINRLKFW